MISNRDDLPRVIRGTETSVLRVFLFGNFQIEPSVDEHIWESRSSARALLKLLLCSPQRQASKSQLAGILWPETDEKKARQSLRTACKVLSKVLKTATGEDLLETAQRYILQLAGQSRLWVDIDAFEQTVALASEATDLQEALLLWKYAKELFRGSFLISDRLQEWVAHPWVKTRQQKLRRMRRRVIRHLSNLYIQMGQLSQAENILEAHLTQFPTDQDALYRLMKLLLADGCLEGALSYYKQCQRALAANGKQPAEYGDPGCQDTKMAVAKVYSPVSCLMSHRFGTDCSSALVFIVVIFDCAIGSPAGYSPTPHRRLRTGDKDPWCFQEDSPRYAEEFLRGLQPHPRHFLRNAGTARRRRAGGRRLHE